MAEPRRSRYPSPRSRALDSALRARRGLILVTGAIDDGPHEFLVALGNELERREKRTLGLFRDAPSGAAFEHVVVARAWDALDEEFARAALLARARTPPDAVVFEQIVDRSSARAVYDLAESTLALAMLWGSGAKEAASLLRELLGIPAASLDARLRVVIAPRPR
jgi:hypothetical protein